MSTLVTLSSRQLRVCIDPNRGNIITSLYANEKEWIYIDKENYHSDERPKCGCPVLFPYMGSLKDDTLRLNNKEYPAGIHGVVHTNVWEIIEKKDDCARFFTSSNMNSLCSYPFTFELETTISIKENTLTYKMQIHNTSTSIMPCDVGFHPFFKISGLKDIVLQMDETAIDIDDESYAQITNKGKLYENIQDISYIDGNTRISIHLVKNLNNVYLYSGKPDEFLVIEPWTSSVNAINEKKQYFTMKANEIYEVVWQICFEEIRV